ncbi:LytTR family DNA-binding domain-containing protein [uncultured Flavobacterium sp.]|uniref:LytR/AlgR family response regulator transcription factor n=1 Tax=uncultured Flavobacterium sp. TaxID=165435 RepID=UPI0025E935AE|nr:LytTR family DNA-binding domain-containing protein [uncultured Flavobacterium sp.]
MKITCIIVDDEPPAIRLLEKYVERIPSLDKLAVFSDSLKALEYLNSNRVDVVFLDIQMPQLTGLQLSKIIGDNVKVIFTTAYPDFALDGFDLNATDYLLKPIAFERFYKAVSKVLPDKAATTHFSPAADYIFLKTDGKNKFTKIFLNDILYAEALQNYVSIHTVSGTVVTHSTLKNILDLLPASGFIQTHRSYAVAIHHIDTTDSFSVFIKGRGLPLGNTYKEAFFKRIGM